MALLSVEKRKEYFKYLGLGSYCKKNIKKFQKIAFPDQPEEHDGDYCVKTDKALRHWRNVKRYCKNFEPEEFKCGCKGRYCTGYPTQMRAKTLAQLQSIRDHFGKPIIVTSGLRCPSFNARLSGSSSQSRHMKGKAVDFYIKGITDTLAGRKKVIRYAKKLKNHHYSYCNGYNSNGYAVNAPNMGSAVHTDTE